MNTLVFLLACATGTIPDTVPGKPETKVPTPPAALVTDWKLSPWYKKALFLGPLPIMGSSKVRDESLWEARWILERMMDGREDLINAIAAAKIRVTIMAFDERTLDVPEHSDLTPGSYWNRRARGLGATRHRPSISAGEENLLEMPGDPYRGENILIHEFGHVVHEIGLAKVDPTFDKRLKAAYEKAVKAGTWKGGYAATNHKEYWAEGVQAWFDCNDSRNLVVTRAEISPKDPDLAALLKEVFGDKPWRYAPPSRRAGDQKAHLNGYDPLKGPKFQWSPEEEKTPVR